MWAAFHYLNKQQCSDHAVHVLCGSRNERTGNACLITSLGQFVGDGVVTSSWRMQKCCLGELRYTLSWRVARISEALYLCCMYAWNVSVKTQYRGTHRNMFRGWVAARCLCTLVMLLCTMPSWSIFLLFKRSYSQVTKPTINFSMTPQNVFLGVVSQATQLVAVWILLSHTHEDPSVWILNHYCVSHWVMQKRLWNLTRVKRAFGLKRSFRNPIWILKLQAALNGPSQSTRIGVCRRRCMLPSGHAQATPSAEEVVALWFGGLLLPVWNNVRWSQKNCVNCCMIPWTKTESMVRLLSWLKRMCTRGMMQWNSFRKKLKESSSSSLTNPPASRTVVGSNSPNGFKTLDDVTFVLKQCSLHRYGSSILRGVHTTG